MEDVETRAFVVRDDRRRVALRGFAMSATRDSDVTVADLSYAGCQIRSADSFEQGETFELRVVKRGAAQAEICWVHNDRAGVRFVN